MGTVAYISPELITGEPADGRSDIYAVGIMLYELLTGRQPFSAESPIQIAFQHVNESVPAPSAAVPGLASDLDELVEWCTARDPEDRPRDATALLGELRHIRTTLTDEQLDFGAAGTAAAGLGPAGSATQAIPTGGDATSVLADLQQGATRAYPRSVLPAGITEDEGNDDGADTAEGIEEDEGAELSPRAAARIARRDEKAARKEWAREAQRPLAKLEPSRSRARGWILTAVLLLAAALLAVAGWFFGMGPGAPVNIPMLGGRTAAAAVQELAALGVDSSQRQIFDEKVDAGLVVGSEPSAGTQIRRYEDVRLLVSKGPELFAVPNIVGRSPEDAEKALLDANLELGKSTKAYNESVDAGLVVSQATAPDKEVRRGTEVNIVVSRGPAPVKVPDIEDMDAAEAERTLAAAGLKGKVTGEEFSRRIPKGTVLSQLPRRREGRPRFDHRLRGVQGPAHDRGPQRRRRGRRRRRGDPRGPGLRRRDQGGPGRLLRHRPRPGPALRHRAGRFHHHPDGGLGPPPQHQVTPEQQAQRRRPVPFRKRKATGRRRAVTAGARRDRRAWPGRRRPGTPSPGTGGGSGAGRRRTRRGRRTAPRGSGPRRPALGDVVAGHLHVQAAGVGAQRVVDLEEAADLVDDVLEVTGLVAVVAGDGVAVHRVGHPEHLRAGGGDLLHQVGSFSRMLLAPMRLMKVRRPGSRFGSSLSISASASSASCLGPSFTPIGLRTRERKSTWAPSSWRVRSPIHRKWAEVS